MFQLFFSTLFHFTFFAHSQNAVVPNSAVAPRTTTSFSKVAPIHKVPRATLGAINRGGTGSWDDNN